MSELVLLAAIDRGRVIGLNNRLPWHIPEDLRRFKALTAGHAVLMGRKTWESLPEKFRPLPGRQNIVISRNPAYPTPGAQRAASLDAALAACVAAPIAFVIGGAEIYALSLGHADRLELTEIETHVTGDAWFPAWNAADWIETAREAGRPAPGQDAPAYAFVTYRRRNPRSTAPAPR